MYTGYKVWDNNRNAIEKFTWGNLIHLQMENLSKKSMKNRGYILKNIYNSESLNRDHKKLQLWHHLLFLHVTVTLHSMLWPSDFNVTVIPFVQKVSSFSCILNCMCSLRLSSINWEKCNETQILFPLSSFLTTSILFDLLFHTYSW